MAQYGGVRREFEIKIIGVSIATSTTEAPRPTAAPTTEAPRPIVARATTTPTPTAATQPPVIGPTRTRSPFRAAQPTAPAPYNYSGGSGSSGGEPLYITAESPQAVQNEKPPEKGTSENNRSAQNIQSPQNPQPAYEPPPRPAKVVSLLTGVELNTANTVRYIYGFDDSTVRPNEGITRAQFAQVIFNLALDGNKENADPETITASDVNRDMWYSKAIAYSLGKKIFNGYPDGTFKPERVITRAELCAILYTYFDLSSLDISYVKLTDISGHWAERSIKIVAAYNVVSGYPDSTFKPDQAVTRAEFVSLMNRLLMRISIVGYYSPGANEYIDIDETNWAYEDIMNASGKEDQKRAHN
jgi:hypothetical protein